MENFSKYYMPSILIGLLVVIGFSVNYHYQETEIATTIDDQVLERAYNDVISEKEIEIVPFVDDNKTIKIYGNDNELLDSRVLEPNELPDEDFASLINKSSLIAEYSNSYIYKVKD